MTNLSAAYAPGPWVAASGPSTWLLVDLALDDARLAACWTAVAAGDADAVLDVLLGEGISALPDFALVDVQASGTRIVARHPARVTIAQGDETRSISGMPGRTWTDVDLDGVFETIEVDAGTAVSSLRLPLAQGIGSAGALTLGATPNLVAGQRSGPEPAEPVGDRPEDEPVATDSSDPLVQTTDPVEAVDGGIKDDPIDEDDMQQPDEGAPASAVGSDYYSLLLGSTVDRDALLQKLAAEDPDEDPEAAPDVIEAIPEPTSGLTAIWQPEHRMGPDVVDAPVAESSLAPPPAAPGGLIDNVPWMSGGAPAPASPAPLVPDPAPVPFPVPAAVPVAPVPPPPVAADQPNVDADIRTVNRAALLQAMNVAAVPTGPTVLAVRCPRKHLTPAYSERCRVCGDEVDSQDPVQEPRPALGKLVLSTGETVVLDRDIVLGRAPETDVEDPALRPSLVKITESSEVSRMHLRITLDGWQPMIRDLGSANGSTLTLTSSPPQQLRPREDYVLEPGAEVSLADVVSFRFEVTG